MWLSPAHDGIGGLNPFAFTLSQLCTRFTGFFSGLCFCICQKRDIILICVALWQHCEVALAFLLFLSLPFFCDSEDCALCPQDTDLFRPHGITVSILPSLPPDCAAHTCLCWAGSPQAQVNLGPGIHSSHNGFWHE